MLASRLRVGQLSILGVRKVHHSYHWNTEVFTKQIPSSAEDHYPLTKREALSFITNILNIPQEKIYTESNRLSLLNNVIYQMRSAVPFTNIPILIADKESEDFPTATLNKCKEEVLSCNGGQCYWINSFMKHLLSFIGFNTDFIGAGNRATSLIYDLHQGVIVRDVSYPGSIHLVEAGLPYPIVEAIPLNFEDESPCYVYGKFVSKYFNCGRGIFKYCTLYRKDRSFLKPWDDILEAGGKVWKVNKEYRTEQVKPLSNFTKIVELCMSYMHLMPVLYHNFLIVGCPKGKLVTIDKHKVTTMTKTGEYTETQISSVHELIKTVKKYFPQISEANVMKAVTIVNENKSNWGFKNR